jgi:cyclic pyranopterin phosphate synthase
MSGPTTDIGGVRFLLHGETDGILLSENRPTSLASDIPEASEIRTLLRVLIKRGARRVRLVGDDPALRQDLPDLVRMVAEIPGVIEVALTTGGRGLRGRLGLLSTGGLRTLNFDLDTLRRERYARLIGHDGFDEVWSAVEEAIHLGITVRLNTVLQHGVNLDELDAFVDLTAKHPVEVRFLEWNTDIDRLAPPDQFVPTWEAMALVKPPLLPRDGDRHDGQALRFEILGHVGGIGFVANMTEHHCALCNRLGLTDYGEIQSCAFGRGLNLVRHLRSKGGVASVETFVDRIWRRKVTLAAKLSGLDALPAPSLGAARA